MPILLYGLETWPLNNPISYQINQINHLTSDSVDI